MNIQYYVIKYVYTEKRMESGRFKCIRKTPSKAKNLYQRPDDLKRGLVTVSICSQRFQAVRSGFRYDANVTEIEIQHFKPQQRFHPDTGFAVHIGYNLEYVVTFSVLAC